MKVIAINGSPRKNGNTARMLKKYLEGASSENAEVNTKLVNLYDLKFTGCVSCFTCKRKSGNPRLTCVVKDDLYELLHEVTMADAVAIGSPIYFGDITGQLRSFLERLMFPLLTYTASYSVLTPKRFPVTMIYTMNVPREMIDQVGYLQHWRQLESTIGRIFSEPQLLYAFNTYQFNDYNNYVMEVFTESEKAAYRDIHFPRDLKAAYDNGRKTAQRITKPTR